MKRMMRVLVSSGLVVGMLLTALIPQQNLVFAASSSSTYLKSDYTNHWAKNEISWAVQNHFMWRNADGTFKPDETITQGQFLTTFTATLGLVARAPYPQTAKSWANPAYEKAFKAGWITPEIKIDPNAKMTRWEAAKWMMNAWGHKDVKDPLEYGRVRRYLNCSYKFVNGHFSPKGIEAYRDVHYFAKTALPTDNFTRAETAYTMKQLHYKWTQTIQARKYQDEIQKSLYIKNGMVYGKVPKFPFIRFDIEASVIYFDEKGGMKELKGNFMVPAKGNITFSYTNQNSTTVWVGWDLPKLQLIDSGDKFFREVH